MPPDGRDRVRLLERALLELTQERDAFFPVEFARLPVVEVVEHAVGLPRVVDRRLVVRQEFLQLQVGLVHIVAVEIERGVESRIVFLLRGEIELGFQLLVLDVDAKLAPLIDQEHADRRVRHRHVAVGQREREVGMAGVRQQFLRLGARGVDVFREAGQLQQFGLGRGELVARAQETADVAHQRDFLQRLRATPAVDTERQRFSHALIVERFFARVERHDQAAYPRRLLDHRLVAERLDDAVTIGGRMAAELGHDFTCRQRVDHRRAGDEEREKTVQVRFAFLEIAVEAAPAPVRTGNVLDERERPGAHDVALRPVRIDLQFRRAIDAVPRAREIGQHGGVGFFQLEHHRQRIGRFNRGDVGITFFAQRQHAFRRLADAVVGRLDVFRAQDRAIVKLHALLQLEGIGKAVFGDRPRLRDVADDFWILRGIEFQQRRVMRPHGVDECERRLRMAIVIRRLGTDRELEQSAGHRSFGGDTRQREQARRADHQQTYRLHWFSSSLLNSTI